VDSCVVSAAIDLGSYRLLELLLNKLQKLESEKMVFQILPPQLESSSMKERSPDRLVAPRLRKHSVHRRKTNAGVLSRKGAMLSRKAANGRQLFASRVFWYNRSRLALLGAGEPSIPRMKIVALLLSHVIHVDRNGIVRQDGQLNAAKELWLDFLKTLRACEIGALTYLMADETGLGYMNAARSLCDYRDKEIRIAVNTAAEPVRLEIWKYALFCGRYEIDPGRPLHYSKTSIVVCARDHYLFEIYLCIYEQYMIEDDDDETVNYLDKEGFIDCLYDLCYEFSEMLDLSEEEMEVAFIQCCTTDGRVSKATFLHFCRWRIGEDRRVAIKFMRKQAQFDFECEVRDQLEAKKSPCTPAKPAQPRTAVMDQSPIPDGNLPMTRSGLHTATVSFHVAPNDERPMSPVAMVPACPAIDFVMPVLSDFPLKPSEYQDAKSAVGKETVKLVQMKSDSLQAHLRNLRIDTVKSEDIVSYNKAIAMPMATETLAARMSVAFDPAKGLFGKGLKIAQIKVITNELATCLCAIHQCGVTHGDVKPQNIAYLRDFDTQKAGVRQRMVLLDFDASGCEFAGFKYSSAYLPPEMFCRLDDEPNAAKLFPYSDKTRRERFYFNSCEKKFYGVKAYDVKSLVNGSQIRFRELLEKSYELVRLSPALDIWAFGMIIFSLFSGKNTFFDTKSEDRGNLTPDKFVFAYRLNDSNSTASTILAKEISQLVTDLDAQDLLRKIFVADPKQRIQSMATVLQHPFLTEPAERALSAKQKHILDKFKANVLNNIRAKRPIHVALLRRELMPQEYLSSHLHTIRSVDPLGRNAMDVALAQLTAQVHGGSSCAHLSEDLVLLLLTETMLLDRGDNILSKEASTVWLRFLRCPHLLAFKVLTAALKVFEKYLPMLSVVIEDNNKIDCRHSHTIPKPSRDLIKRATFISGVYDLEPSGRVSGNSWIFHGMDYTSMEADPIRVSARFIYSKKQFLNDLLIRKEKALNSSYVVPVMKAYCLNEEDNVDELTMQRVGDLLTTGDEAVTFFAEANKFLSNQDTDACSFCIITENVRSTLDKKLEDELNGGNYSKNATANAVYSISQSLCGCISYFHSIGIVLGNLEPRNLVVSVDCQVRFTWLSHSSLLDEEGRGKSNVDGDCEVSYLAPELLANTVIAVRNNRGRSQRLFPEHDAVLASPSQDLWSLGVVLFLLFTSMPLFHSAEVDVKGAFCWNGEIIQQKLASVPNAGFRKLLQCLLVPDPADRPSIEKASAYLAYPRSLADIPPDFDVFLSYRVASDYETAHRVYKQLTLRGVRVWWDKRCIAAGTDWEEEFCAGLANSCYCICLVSKGGLARMRTLSATSICDNVLLEWILALNLKQRDMLKSVIPLSLDSVRANEFPDVVVEAVAAKLLSHFKKIPSSGLASGKSQTVSTKPVIALTVRETLETLLQYQGANIKNDQSFSDEIYKLSVDLLRNRDLIESKRRSSEFVANQHISQLEVDIEDLREENKRLQGENTELKDENKKLREENTLQATQLERLHLKSFGGATSSSVPSFSGNVNYHNNVTAASIPHERSQTTSLFPPIKLN
jgi:serine/threonine protein kinase